MPRTQTTNSGTVVSDTDQPGFVEQESGAASYEDIEENPATTDPAQLEYEQYEEYGASSFAERPRVAQSISPAVEPGLWTDIQYIDARITRLTKEAVYLDCLINRSERQFQERVFDRSLLEGEVPLEIGGFVVITIQKRAGKIIHSFSNGNKRVNPESFEEAVNLDPLGDFDFDEPFPADNNK